MNSIKTELFKVSFLADPRAKKSVLIEWLKDSRCGEYSEHDSLSSLCSNVERKMQDHQLSPTEAVKVIGKSASFFMIP
jgi:hypothetical protein